MKVFAHRGYSGRYPENTMTAFKKAYEAGADGIELDVQLSRDGEIVIIHDEKIDRTCDGEGFVKDYDLLELKKFNAAVLHNDMVLEERIPSLREYLEWVKNTDLITNIELKSGVYYYDGLEEKTVKMVREFGLQDKVILSSFNHPSVMLVKELMPEAKCGFLTENGGIENAGIYCKQFGMEYYHPDRRDLTLENAKNCLDNGIGINVWTVNDMESFERLCDFNVTSIITNYPKSFKDCLKNK